MFNELSYEVGAWEHCEVRCLILGTTVSELPVVSWCLVFERWGLLDIWISKIEFLKKSLYKNAVKIYKIQIH